MLNPNLPPGFRFHPTDEELVIYYLKQKMASPSSPLVSIIPDIDLYKFNPWELPAKASFGGNEWFYFTPRDRKYPNGVRPNRAAGSGYWKATGTDKPILTSDGLQCLGVKKALVFYDGRPPKGVKSDWIMDEYRLLKDSRSFTGLQGSMRLDDWVLCRIRQKANNIPQKTVESQENCNNHIPLFTFRHSNPEDVANDIAAKTQVYDEAPKKIDEAVLDEKAQQFLGFNGGKFDPIELSDVKSNSPPRMVCHIKSTLKRMHLLESSDEFEETITAPIKRQCITSRHTASGTGIFQIPYLANWSHSMLQSYSISPN